MPRANALRGIAGALILIGALLSAGGCSDDDSVVGPPPGEESWGWELVSPVPPANDLYSICGDGAGGLFAVGNAGTVLHLDGATRSVATIDEGIRLLQVLARGPDDAYAYSMWPSILYHFDGRRWRRHTDFGTIRDAWLGDPGVLFVATSFEIYELDGAFWIEHETPSPPCPGPEACLKPNHDGIWGTAPDDVYVVGSGGYLTHYDGTGWQLGESGTTADLRDIWGSGADDIFAVGAGGTIVHYDGQAWEPQTSGTSEALMEIWGSGPADVYVRGLFGTILRYDGAAWSPLPIDAEVALNGIGGTGPGEAYVVGEEGAIFAREGSAWSRISAGPRQDLGAVWGCSAADLWLAGGGAILHYDGQVLEEAASLPVFGLWGTGCGDVIGVGQGIYRYDGTAWTPETAEGAEDLMGVWGRDAGEIYAVGMTGAILRHDGNGWQVDHPAGGEGLFGVWGGPSAGDDVLAVGLSGTILRRTVAGWSADDSGTDAALIAVWGSSPTDVYAVGQGVVLRYDGTSWSPIDITSDTATLVLASVWGRSADDVFIGGLRYAGQDIVPLRGVVFHYDGVKWSREPTGSQQAVTGIWGDDAGTGYAVGDGGTFLKRARISP